MLAVFSMAVPHADTALAQVAPFLPMFATSVFLLEGMTAFLLAIQFYLRSDAFIGILAAAYAFVATIAIAQLLVFPEVFSASGLLGAGPQSAVWLWTFWHAGFPLLVSIALLAWAMRERQAWKKAWQAFASFAVMAGPLIALCLLALVVFRGGALLPSLISGDGYQRLSTSPLAWAVMLPNAVALLGCVYLLRFRSLLGVWLAVALLASSIDSAMTLLATERYSLGWYLARLISLVSSSTVLAVLLWEIGRTYRRVMEQNIELTDKALRDGLTDTFNRRHLDDTLPKLLAQAERKRQVVSVVMFDVDHFKAFNDSQGHVAGDECLLRVTRAAKTALRRPLDLLARYGGEEFCVLLPDTDAPGARAVAESLREAIEREAITRRDDYADVVTVSLGVASLAAHASERSPEALLAAADEALYRAKRAGRNRVCCDQAGTVNPGE